MLKRWTNLKTYFRFDTRAGTPVLVKVGISSVDIDGALKNLRTELNHWDFDKVRADATAAWNAELNKITGHRRQRRAVNKLLHRALSRDDRAESFHGR